MKIPVIFGLAFGIALLLMAAGCTQANQPAPIPTSLPTTVPTTVPTAIPTPIPPTPVPTTIAPAIPLPDDIKDTPLLFGISAPKGYTGTTIRVTEKGTIADTTRQDTVFKTTIFNPAISRINKTVNDNSGNYSPLADSLTIFSYSTSSNPDQNYINKVRGTGAAINESTVTYNGITYTRIDAPVDPFDGTPGETVFFVGKKSSANVKGYLPILIYTITNDGTFSQATYENMVKSFQYYPIKDIDNAPGAETDRPTYYQ
jgi:hypothetical protein